MLCSGLLTMEIETPFLGKGKVGKTSRSEFWSERIDAVIAPKQIQVLSIIPALFNHS
ncbi:hypothetical protein DDD_2640 [Nonlabens dokdonensis DSW-6]|uniref:Uncharacterized protein n=2 Tax=Nonlabens dokdonensis TaxID=328515 RepID=L7WC33_NONDD|nr:hypothetical protein DDD_2640 [Nonlabens dokdonensis DSW-6]